MATEFGGIYNGVEFTIPPNVEVWPVHEMRNGRIYAQIGKRTNRESKYYTFRLLPTDGSFQSFQLRNMDNGTKFVIAMFDTPVRTQLGMIIGCVVDFRKVSGDLPF